MLRNLAPACLARGSLGLQPDGLNLASGSPISLLCVLGQITYLLMSNILIYWEKVYTVLSHNRASRVADRALSTELAMW